MALHKTKNVSGRKEKLTNIEKDVAARKRQQIISDAETMKRLELNADFKRYCELLGQDKSGLMVTLLKEVDYKPGMDEKRIRLIARVNQIDRILNKPKTLIWLMEQLTEVREAMKKRKTRERQALGNKTGGENE